MKPTDGSRISDLGSPSPSCPRPRQRPHSGPDTLSGRERATPIAEIANCKWQNDRELTLHCFGGGSDRICGPLRLPEIAGQIPDLRY